MSQLVPNPAILPGVGGPVPTGPAFPAARPAATTNGQGTSFADVLREQQAPAGVQFSRHALERVQRRGIDVDPATLARLGSGVDRAASKGARESVVLVDGTAFVVSVRNRTVITAVDPEHMREHVFTNIDSAVIA